MDDCTSKTVSLDSKGTCCAILSPLMAFLVTMIEETVPMPRRKDSLNYASRCESLVNDEFLRKELKKERKRGKTGSPSVPVKVHERRGGMNSRKRSRILGIPVPRSWDRGKTGHRRVGSWRDFAVCNRGSRGDTFYPEGRKESSGMTQPVVQRAATGLHRNL